MNNICNYMLFPELSEKDMSGISTEYLTQSRRNKDPNEVRLTEVEFDWKDFPIVEDIQILGVSSNTRIGSNSRNIVRKLKENK
jgi:hypothetical protein